MFELTIGIIGRISVGKSSIAKVLSHSTGMPNTSFGAFLVKYSNLNNLAINRKALQDLGENFINKDPKKFLTMVLESVPNSNKIIFPLSIIGYIKFPTAAFCNSVNLCRLLH